MAADLSRLIASTASIIAINSADGSFLNLGSLSSTMTSLTTINATKGDDHTQIVADGSANIENAVISAGCTANLQSIIDSLNSQLTAEVARLNALP